MSLYKLSFVSGVCIGLEETTDTPGYTHIVCNTILPATDKEYAAQKHVIEGRMRLFAQAPEMMLAIKEFCDRVDKGEIRSKKTYAKFKDILDELNKPL